MSYTLHICDQNNPLNGFDVSELAVNITHTTTLSGQAGKLTFTLKRDPKKILKISNGNIVKFWNNGTGIFKGYVFTIKTNGSENYDIVAYDQMRYLQNHDFFLLDNKNLSSVFKLICNNNKIKCKVKGKASSAPNLKKHLFSDVSYFEILEHCITESNIAMSLKTNTKDTLAEGTNNESNINDKAVKFFIRDEFGTLVLNDIESNMNSKSTGNFNTTEQWTGGNALQQIAMSLTSFFNGNLNFNVSKPLIIGTESLMTDYEYSLDIDKDTYNEVYIMQNATTGSEKNTRLAFAKQDGKTIRKWGILRKIVNVKEQISKGELQDYAKKLLQVGATVSKKLRIEALGYDGLTAGDGFIFKLDRLGITQRVYIISATHTYDPDHHRMSLEVSTSRDFTEVV